MQNILLWYHEFFLPIFIISPGNYEIRRARFNSYWYHILVKNMLRSCTLLLWGWQPLLHRTVGVGTTSHQGQSKLLCDARCLFLSLNNAWWISQVHIWMSNCQCLAEASLFSLFGNWKICYFEFGVKKLWDSIFLLYSCRVSIYSNILF